MWVLHDLNCTSCSVFAVGGGDVTAGRQKQRIRHILISGAQTFLHMGLASNFMKCEQNA